MVRPSMIGTVDLVRRFPVQCPLDGSAAIAPASHRRQCKNSDGLPGVFQNTPDKQYYKNFNIIKVKYIV